MKRTGLKYTPPSPTLRVILGSAVGSGGSAVGVKIVQYYLKSFYVKSWLSTMPRNGRKSLWWVVGVGYLKPILVFSLWAKTSTEDWGLGPSWTICKHIWFNSFGFREMDNLVTPKISLRICDIFDEFWTYIVDWPLGPQTSILYHRVRLFVLFLNM